MWFIIVLFLILGLLGVLFRSPKTLVLLASAFSFIAILYTPWFPIVLLLLSGIAVIFYLNTKEKKEVAQMDFKEAVKRDLQEEVEINSMLKNMKKHEQRIWFKLNPLEEKRKLLGTIRIKLLQKTDTELLNFVLSLDKTQLNSEVPNNGFPAWDIAYKLKVNNWSVSPKQRKAIINIVSYYYTNYVFQEALFNIRKR